MKIVDLQFEESVSTYIKPLHIANEIAAEATNIRVSLLTDSGITGKGEASPSFRVNGESVPALIALRAQILEEVKGMSVLSYMLIFDVMDRFSSSSSSLKLAIQYAVVDAFCQHTGIKPYQFFGGRKEYVETDKTVSIGSLEETIADVETIVSEGFNVVKMKVGEDLQRDIERVVSVSDRFRNISLIVDANTGYTAKEALFFADALYRERCPVVLLEQPVPVHDLDGLKLVRQKSQLPVGADECVRTRYDAFRLVKNDCVDFINVKLMKSGLSDALAIIEIARSANISLMIGCMCESGYGISQSVHFAAGTGAFVYHDLDSHMLLRNTGPVGFDQRGAKLFVTGPGS